jgi:hypothetical protein
MVGFEVFTTVTLGVPPFGLYRLVVRQKSKNVSEDYILLGLLLDLKLEAMRSSEMLMNFHRTT